MHFIIGNSAPKPTRTIKQSKRESQESHEEGKEGKVK